MKLGIKVGPDNVSESITNLQTLRPQASEVWFNIARKDEYTELFRVLTSVGCEVGLHYWGALPDGTWTNLAYPDSTIIKETLKMMKQTIDIAAHHSHKYVNIHPGSAANVRIDFAHESFELLSKPIPLSQATDLFLEQYTAIHEYAKARGIVLTVETVPQRVTTGWYSVDARSQPYNIYELPVDVILEVANRGMYVANDFSHTVCNCFPNTADEAWTFLESTTRTLAAQTRLIHIGFVVEPFNGTDFHDMLDNPLLLTNKAVPNISQMKQLFRIFADRSDIWVITEPKADHAKNYQLAKAIIDAS